MTDTRPYVPAGLTSITPYLTVDDAAQLLDFLVNVFDAVILERHEDGGRVVHAKVEIDGSCIEASHATEEWPALSAALHVYVPDVDATHARALASGAAELYAPTDHDYGERGSGVRGPQNIRYFLATAQ